MPVLPEAWDYRISLSDKVKHWCSSPTFCGGMAVHWLLKEKWLNDSASTSTSHPLTEIWDGTRFSWFWDPNK